MIEVKNLSKTYSLPTQTLTVLKNIDFIIPSGIWAAIVGPSGSGKSTLLSILAGLEDAEQGEVDILGRSLFGMDEDERALFRAAHIGFIFQSFRLLPHLTATENVQIPLEILGKRASIPAREFAGRARAMLESVGLGHRLHHRSSQLSGGEQQRVAIARAFVTQPQILFADEPTGNLDSVNGEQILKLMETLRREHGSTLVVVTHDRELAKRAELQLVLRDGELQNS